MSIGPSTPCPDCRETGAQTVFVDFEDGSGICEDRPCHRCGGTGRVSAEMSDWISRGRALRNARIVRWELIWQMSERLGVGPSEISNAETGRIDPAPLEE